MTYDDAASLSMSKGTNLFYDAAPDCWQRFAGAMIVQAARDAGKGSVEAKSWLEDPETADTWFFIAGLDGQAVLRWIRKGCRMGSLKGIKKGSRQ